MTSISSRYPGKRALFITHASHVSDKLGGVQKCSHEYLEALKIIGFSTEIFKIQDDRRLSTKLLRQIITNPYIRPMHPKSRRAIGQLAENSDVIFVNQVYLGQAVSSELKAMNKRPPVVLLSHGCELTDFLHLIRLRDQYPLSGRVRPNAKIALGSILSSELKARRDIDAVVTISPGDSDLEKWLGVKHVHTIPRSILPSPLEWAPVDGRFGYVGTLDHAPNLEGLVDVLEEMRQSPHDLKIRLVSGSRNLGQWLSDEYPFVEYLGRLSDNALNEEARSWQAFIHPIFCFARGASTKLADPIQWSIPIITTPLGRRGYEWKDGSLIEVDSAAEFVGKMTQLSEHDFERARADVATVAKTAPSITDIAKSLEQFLCSLPERSHSIN